MINIGDHQIGVSPVISRSSSQCDGSCWKEILMGTKWEIFQFSTGTDFLSHQDRWLKHAFFQISTVPLGGTSHGNAGGATPCNATLPAKRMPEKKGPPQIAPWNWWCNFPSIGYMRLCFMCPWSTAEQASNTSDRRESSTPRHICWSPS